jgi:hypothetical protein
MYSEKMVCAIKVNGKILREHSDKNNTNTVYIPFGSEYSFLLKNLSSGRRACVWITIDGKEAVDGGLIVSPGQSIDLERFIEGGQLDKGLRFKFIERTAKIEDNRGIGLEDGLIKVSFEFEPESTPYKYNGYTGIRGNIDNIYLKSASRGISGQSLGGEFLNASYSAGACASASATSDVAYASNAMAADTQMLSQKNEVGITVGGSVSEQKFTSTFFSGDGVKHDMIFAIKGAVGEAPVEQPVTVKTKQKCPTCGHTNKSGAKFCAECGTGLVVV